MFLGCFWNALVTCLALIVVVACTVAFSKVVAVIYRRWLVIRKVDSYAKKHIRSNPEIVVLKFIDFIF